MNKRFTPKVLVTFLLACSIVSTAVPFNYVSANEEATSTETNTTPEVLGVRAPSSQVVQANSDFQNALGTYTKTKGSSRTTALAQLILAAKTRKAKMINEARTNPTGFLSSVISSDTYNQLPPSVRDLVEQSTTLTGKLSIKYADGIDDRDSSYIFQLQEVGSKKLYTLHFAKGAPLNEGGAVIKVTGVREDNEVVLSQSETTTSGTAGVKVVQAPTQVTYVGDQKILAMKVRFNNTPTSTITDAAIIDNLFTGPHSANAYYKESSYNQLSFSGDVVTPWLNIPYDNTNCEINGFNTSNWTDAADAAATAAGYNLSGYIHLVYYFDNTLDCPRAGLATMYQEPTRTMVFETHGIPSWPSFNYGVPIHELGHNLNLQHASTIYCGNTKAIDAYANCSFTEYGDIYDVMGSNITTPNTLNGAHRAIGGWLPASNIKTVNVSGTYTIAPIETAGTTVKVLKIPRPNEANGLNYYYLDYRQPIGSDAGLYPISLAGANVIISPSNTNQYLSDTVRVDTTPGTSVDNHTGTPLSDNATFRDDINNVTIKQLSHDANGVTVQITLDSSACVRNAPSLVVTPPTQTAASGMSVTYNVAVSNNDSTGCSSTPESFALGTGNLPAGFTSNITSITLPPGGAGSVPMTVKSPTNAANGTYNFITQVTGNAGSDTQSVSYVVANSPNCIQSPPTISVLPTSQAGASGQALNYAVSVTNRDSSVCASSTFHVSVSNPPSGFTSNNPTVTVAAGYTNTTTLTVTSPSNATNNSYNFTITVSDPSAVSHVATTGATYVVQTTCNRAAPVVSVSPIVQSGTPGQALRYTVIVANKDATNCGSSTFNVSVPSLSSGYTSNSIVVTSVPGSYGLGTLTVTSSSNTTNSTTFDIKAVDSNVPVHTGTTSATYIIDNVCSYQNPSYSISPASQTGNAGQTLNYTTTITNNDSAACGPTTYYLAPVVSTEINGSSSASSVTLNPGQSATQTFAVTSATTSVAGDKEFVVRASWSRNPMGARNVVTDSAIYTVASSGPSTQPDVFTGSRGFVRGDSTTVPNLSPEMIARLKQITQYLFPGVIFPK